MELIFDQWVYRLFLAAVFAIVAMLAVAWEVTR